MRSLTAHEKRTIRLATIVVVAFLALFFGWRALKFLEGRRSEYARLVKEAQGLRQEIKPYESRVLVISKLMEEFHLDPAKLAKATVVGEASAAIQKAAASGGVQLGPVRENRTQGAGKELATIQMEGTGPVPAVMTFLHRLESVGFPLIVDSVQLNSDARPGALKIKLSIVILDFEQWKKQGAPNA